MYCDLLCILYILYMYIYIGYFSLNICQFYVVLVSSCKDSQFISALTSTLINLQDLKK